MGVAGMFHNSELKFRSSILLMALALVSCDAGSFVDPGWSDVGEPASIVLESVPATISDGDRTRISVRVYDTNGALLDGVVVLWSTSDSAVAYVTADEELIGEGPGEATITASTGSLSTSTTVEVVRTPVRLAITSGQGQEAGPGDVLPDSLVVRALDRRGEPVPAMVVDFVVTDGGGTASPVSMPTDAQGYARTAWTLGSASDQRLEGRANSPAHVRSLQDSVVVFTAHFALGPVLAASVEVTPASASMEVDDTLRFEAIVRDSEGNALPGQFLTWTSSAHSIITVDGTGLATAHAAGSASITATSENVAGSAEVEVTAHSDPAQGTITIDPPSDTLTVSDTLTLTATARDATGALIADAGIEWVSLHPDIAVVDDMGMMVARAAGTALITASALCCAPDSGAFVVNLGAPGTVTDLQAISTTTETVTLRWTEVDDGSGAPANYLVRFAEAPYSHWGNATPVDEGTCSGTVQGVQIGQARICSVAGLVPATSYGFQVIAFRQVAPDSDVFGDVSAVTMATTDAEDGGGTGTLSVSPSSHAFTEIGQELQLSVTAHGPDGQVIDDAGVTWTSSNNEVATVDSTGRVIARSVGTAMIVATALCCSDGAAYVTMSETGSNPDFTNEPAGFTELARNDWSALPGSWGPSRWGTTGGGSPSGWDGPPTEVSIVTDATAPVGGTNVLRGWYPEGFPGGYGAGRTGYSFGSAQPGSVFIGMWVKVDPDFVNHIFQLKWHYVWMSTTDLMWIDWRHRFEGNTSNESAWETSNLRLRFQGSGWGYPAELVEQNVQPSIVEFHRGQWTKLELYMDMGTPGTASGTVRLWQDGVLIVELLNWTFPAGAGGFDRTYHEGTYGGGSQPHPQDQAWYVAQTYISVPGN
jgi:uncharacterized protein YjdB